LYRFFSYCSEYCIIYILLITAYYRYHHFSSWSTETLPPFMSLCLSCLQLLKIFSQYTFRTTSDSVIPCFKCQTQFRKLKEKESLLYPNFCLPHSFFLPGVPRFFLLSFLFCLEEFLQPFFQDRSAADFVFFNLRMSWFPLHIFSLGMGFWVIVLLSLWKYYDIPFGPPWFLLTNWCHSNCFPLLSDFVAFSFQKFNYDVS